MTPVNPSEPKAPGVPSPAAPAGTPTGEPGLSADPAPSTLTPEEQMALYEKDLKETDWGHQPC